MEIEALIVRYAGWYAHTRDECGVAPPVVVLVSVLEAARSLFIRGEHPNALPLRPNRDQFHFAEAILPIVPEGNDQTAPFLRSMLDHLAGLAGEPHAHLRSRRKVSAENATARLTLRLGCVPGVGGSGPSTSHKAQRPTKIRCAKHEVPLFVRDENSIFGSLRTPCDEVPRPKTTNTRQVSPKKANKRSRSVANHSIVSGTHRRFI
jgi:hypothetical protein